MGEEQPPDSDTARAARAGGDVKACCDDGARVFQRKIICNEERRTKSCGVICFIVRICSSLFYQERGCSVQNNLQRGHAVREAKPFCTEYPTRLLLK